MNQLDQVLAFFVLTVWLALVAVTLLRASVAGLFCGNWRWFHPITPSRVDRSEPNATLTEVRFRRRRLELLIALALGWIPGLLVEGFFGAGDRRFNGAVLAVWAAAGAAYLFSSLRRFDKEGRERYLAREITEGRERLDSVP